MVKIAYPSYLVMSAKAASTSVASTRTKRILELNLFAKVLHFYLYRSPCVISLSESKAD